MIGKIPVSQSMAQIYNFTLFKFYQEIGECSHEQTSLEFENVCTYHVHILVYNARIAQARTKNPHVQYTSIRPDLSGLEILLPFLSKCTDKIKTLRLSRY